MSTYFSLLGLGIFLISYSPKALFEPEKKESDKKNFFPQFFENDLTSKKIYLLLGVLTVFIIIGWILFYPLYFSENNIAKAIDDNVTQTIDQANNFINEAIRHKPDNPYAWNHKWTLDKDYNVKDEEGPLGYRAEFFSEIKKDLDTLDSIIPGYQDVWSKYVNLYIMEFDYYNRKWKAEYSLEDKDKADEYLKKAYENLDKSINMNFLNNSSHIMKMGIAKYFDNKEGYINTVKDYFYVHIYLDFCKARKIVKEKIQINEGETTSYQLKGKIHSFTIGKEDVLKIYTNFYDYSNDLYTLFNMKGEVDKAVNDILSNIYPK